MIVFHVQGNKAGLVEAKRSQKYGCGAQGVLALNGCCLVLRSYLWRGTHEQYYWFRLLGFLTSFALALQNVLSYNVRCCFLR